MKKIIAVLMAIILIIGMFQIIAQINYERRTGTHIDKKYSLIQTLNTLEEYGSNIYDFNFFYQDIQGIGWSFDSLTNAFTAKRGESFTIYDFHYGSAPSGTEERYIIRNIYGGTYGYYTVGTESKPNETAGWWEQLTYIGSTISYVLDFTISIGRLFIDIIGSLLLAVVNTTKLLYHLMFDISV